MPSSAHFGKFECTRSISCIGSSDQMHIDGKLRQISDGALKLVRYPECPGKPSGRIRTRGHDLNATGPDIPSRNSATTPRRASRDQVRRQIEHSMGSATPLFAVIGWQLNGSRQTNSQIPRSCDSKPHRYLGFESSPSCKAGETSSQFAHLCIPELQLAHYGTRAVTLFNASGGAIAPRSRPLQTSYVLPAFKRVWPRRRGFFGKASCCKHKKRTKTSAVPTVDGR